jgi:hypothetical protein
MSSNTELDLFSKEYYHEKVLVDLKKVRGRYQKKKHEMNYRKSDPKSDSNCGSCRYSFLSFTGTHSHRKCELIGGTASSATDVSRNYFCDKWEYWKREEK